MTRTARTRIARTLAALLATAALAGLAGCAKPVAEKPAPTPEASAAAFPVTITDDASRSVTVDKAPERIVSLAPGNTEILFELGLGDKVVGVTSYDDYPAAVADIAKVGDFSGPNVEAVAAAKPDIIFATTGVQADVIAKLEALGATVVAVDPQNLAALYSDIEEMGALTGTSERASALVGEMKDGVAEVQKAVADEAPVTVFVEIGQNPLFTTGTGTLMNELLTLAGGKNVVTAAGWVPYSAEQLVKSDPAVYVATKGSSNDPAAIATRPGYKGISAVKNGRIAIVDDSTVSRPGPRVVEGLRTLAKALHPDAFGGQ